MIYSSVFLKRISSLPPKFKGKRILVLGDLMLDHFIRGRVSRISPEAPVPVVAVDRETHAPGGAGNVCSNLSALGAQVAVFGTLGDDLAGHQLLRDLEQRSVDVSGILIDPSRVTTQKSRVVADHQQVVRFDRETANCLSPQSQAELLRRLKHAASDAHALVVSDYGKGIVTPSVVSSVVMLTKSWERFGRR